jgi:hypothetical protein
MKHKTISDLTVQEKMEINTKSGATGAHYDFSYKGIKVDPYRILALYNITHPAQQHAIKKLLRAGTSVKGLERDIDEVIITLNRWKEMLREEQSV